MPSKENSISTKEPASSPEAKLTALGKSLIKAAKPEIAAKALDILAEARRKIFYRLLKEQVRLMNLPNLIFGN